MLEQTNLAKPLYRGRMITRIISAFPGSGKSYFYEQNKYTCIDSDSSKFSWSEKDGVKVRNPEFPLNYIQHIKDSIGKYEFILVSSHKEVRDALLENCLYFYLFYPDKSHKELYMDRYKRRGNTLEFIDLIDKNWNRWLKECSLCTIGCRNINMIFPSLTRELNSVVASEMQLRREYVTDK